MTTRNSGSPTPAEAKPAGSQVRDHFEGFKDTIESLVIAFILAFVFRGFLVEAFVIPTGSMAPTLYGMHGSQVCPDCGWEYAYGMHMDRERRSIKCPNCGRESASHEELPYHLPTASDRHEGWFDPDLKRRDPQLAERLAHLEFQPRSGDRILVFKWPFDLGGEVLGPKPWDVVVFKNPSNGEDNYIKRLVGTPRQVLEIIDGDVYTCSIDALDVNTVSMLEEIVDIKYRQSLAGDDHALWESLARRMNELQRKTVPVITPHLRILRKPAAAQDALWQVVFHQDYLPPQEVRRNALTHWAATGEPGAPSDWDTSSPVLRFKGLGRERQAIQLVGEPIRDFIAYNYDEPTSEESDQNVSDLRLKFVLNYQEGSGGLAVSLSKHEDLFTATLLPSGEMTLERHYLAERRPPTLLASVDTAPWEPGRPLEVELVNLDYRVTLTVRAEGQDPVVIATTDEQYAPSIGGLRRRHAAPRPALARIAAEDLDIDLRHLALDRDVYYRNSSRGQNAPGWGTEWNPIYLREGEYFVLGDNSPASQDSRLWNVVGPHLRNRGPAYQLGTVPHDQLIGNAFFVYWPNGYRVRWMPIAWLRQFGLIPNVGDMRWIR